MSIVCNFPKCKHITKDGCNKPECSLRNDIMNCYEEREQ